MLVIFEIWIYHIFEYFWPPKMNSSCSNRPTKHDVYIVVKIISNTILYYTLEEVEVETNGKLFDDKLDCTEEQMKDQN